MGCGSLLTAYTETEIPKFFCFDILRVIFFICLTWTGLFPPAAGRPIAATPLPARPPSQILTPFTSVQAGNNLRFRHFPYKLRQHLITSDSPLPTPFCCMLWRFSGVSVRSPSDQRIQLQICCWFIDILGVSGTWVCCYWELQHANALPVLAKSLPMWSAGQLNVLRHYVLVVWNPAGEMVGMC